MYYFPPHLNTVAAALFLGSSKFKVVANLEENATEVSHEQIGEHAPNF